MASIKFGTSSVAPYPLDVETPENSGSREHLVESRASSRDTATSTKHVTMSEGGGLDYMELGGVVKNTSFDETHDEEPGPGTGELRRADSAEILHVSLHQGARDGNIDLMKRLVANITTNKKKRINLLDDDKMTPLHYAARYNNYHIVTLLVEHGADVRSIGEDGATPLHLAARYKRSRLQAMKTELELAKRQNSEAKSPDAEIHGKPPARLPPLNLHPTTLSTHRERPNGPEFDGQGQPLSESIIHYLVSKGANVNAQDMYGLAPLHYSAMRGNDVAARELLDCRGINIEAVDKQQMTALHLACTHGNTQVANILIDAKANLRCTDEENGTPLHAAAMEGHLGICKLLFNAAYQKDGWVTISQMVTDTDIEDNTALHLAVDNGHIDVVKLCLEKKSDINTCKKNFSTPLHSAAASGNLDIVELLLQHNARIDALDENQATPLHKACAFNRSQVVEFLLSKRAKIERRDQDNFTPLLIASCYGHSETVKCLLDAGADISKCDKNDKSAIYWCAEEGRQDALNVLLEDPLAKSLLEDSDRYGNVPLHIAAQKGFVGIVKILLDAGAVIDSKNEEEQTPLHLAAKNGRTRIVRELVRRNKTIINDEDELSNSPLHLASLEGHVRALQALIDSGADIQARNCNLWTPLDCAAAKGWMKSVQALLEADSPVDPTDKAKTTPLHLASKNGHVDVVGLLLDWHADLSLCDDTGSNCLDLAIDNNKKDVAMAIINHANWRRAMENAVSDPNNGYYLTPMRKLIRKMPDVAEKVLNRCTETNDKAIENAEYSIAFDYEFLDDMFSNWKKEDAISDAMSSKSDSGFEDDGSLKPSAQPYSKNSTILKMNHPLMIMVHSKREELLGHPLSISLLRHKWNKYGRWVYYTSLFIYCVFLAALTSYILIMPPPYYVYNNGTTNIWYLDGQEKFGQNPNNLDLTPFVEVCKWIVVGLACLNLLKEIFQMFSQKLNYFNIENLMEWSIYILAILLVMDFGGSIQRETQWREDWQYQCGAVCIFLAWINLIVFIRKLPRLGIYVVMFLDVLNTFLKFFIVFLLFIVAFGLAFYVLLMNQEPFKTPQETLVKTFVMMIGEFEYNNIFYGDGYLVNETPDVTSDEYFATTVWYRGATYALFITFLVIMSILIMNLLVGLAVDDIKEVQEQAVLKRYAMQVELALDVEQLIPQFIRRRFIVRKETIMPNYVYGNPVTRLYYYFAGSGAISAPSIAKALNPDKETVDEILQQQEQMSTTISNIRNRMKGMQYQNDKIESMLAAIIAHNNVPYEEEDTQWM